jgi:hypothetical protein
MIGGAADTSGDKSAWATTLFCVSCWGRLEINAISGGSNVSVFFRNSIVVVWKKHFFSSRAWDRGNESQVEANFGLKQTQTKPIFGRYLNSSKYH